MTSRRFVVSWVLCACACALVGCSATAKGTVTGPPGTVTIGTITHVESPTQTITRTISGPNSTTSIAAPTTTASSGSPTESTTARVTTATTPEPAPREADCPYLDGADLQLMSGERTGKITVIDMTPQPICQFYRIVDGDWQVAVRVFQTATPQAAVAAVDTRIPPAESSPADQPAGWTGGYLPLPAGSPASTEFPDATSVYGVSKGNRAVVVWTNRETVRNRTIAVATIEALHW